MSEPEFSLARHAIVVLGAATAALGVTVVLLGVLQPGPAWALTIVGGGIVGCVVAMAVAARWSTRGVRGSGTAPAPD